MLFRSIAGEGRQLDKRRAALLSSTYVLGMALAYAAAGVAAAYSGTMLAAALQNPWVLGAFAAVFVWLALSMFGLYEISLPGFLQTRFAAAQGRLRGGRVASVAVMRRLGMTAIEDRPVAGRATLFYEIRRPSWVEVRL